MASLLCLTSLRPNPTGLLGLSRSRVFSGKSVLMPPHPPRSAPCQAFQAPYIFPVWFLPPRGTASMAVCAITREPCYHAGLMHRSGAGPQSLHFQQACVVTGRPPSPAPRMVPRSPSGLGGWRLHPHRHRGARVAGSCLPLVGT